MQALNQQLRDFISGNSQSRNVNEIEFPTLTTVPVQQSVSTSAKPAGTSTAQATLKYSEMVKKAAPKRAKPSQQYIKRLAKKSIAEVPDA